MRRLLWIAAGIAWFGFLFLVTFYLTFPSDAVVQRARWEVADRSGGAYSLELGDIGPWWLGAAASDVKLYSVPRSGDPTLAFLASDARAKTSLFSLLARAPSVSGSVTPIDGTLYYTVTTGRSDKGDVKVNGVKLSGEAFPLSELLLVSGTTAAGSGGLDIDVDVTGDKSLKKGSGHVKIQGQELTLSELVIPGVGPLGMDVPIESLDIDIDVDKGKATFQRGTVDSTLLKAQISGSMALANSMERSGLDLEILLSDLGSDLQAFKGMLSQAQVDGGDTYKFTCTGTIGRPNCQMGEGRAASRGRNRAASRPNRRATLSGDGGEATARRPRPRPDADELRQRREERLERLRKLREERAAEVADREEEDDEFIDEPDEDEVYDELEDEEFVDEPGEFFDEDEEYYDE